MNTCHKGLRGHPGVCKGATLVAVSVCLCMPGCTRPGFIEEYRMLRPGKPLPEHVQIPWLDQETTPPDREQDVQAIANVDQGE